MARIQAHEVLFHVGADGFARYGTIFRKTRHLERGAPTHRRNSVATQRDRVGIIRPSIADILRVSHYDTDDDGLFEHRAVLLEPTRTNDATDASFEDAGVHAIAGGSSPPTVTNVTEDAVHGTRSIKVVWASGDPNFGVQHVEFDTTTWVNMPDQARGVWTAYVRGPAGATIRFLITGGAQVFNEEVTFTGRWQRIAARVFNNTGSAHTLAIHFHDPSGALTMYVDAVQLEKNARYETSFIDTGDVADDRQGDVFSSSLAIAPQEMTVYGKIIRPIWFGLGTTQINRFFFEISTATPQFRMYSFSGSNYWASIWDGVAERFVGPVIPAGDPLDFAVHFEDPTTSGARVRMDVGSGYGGFSSASTAFSKFGNQIMQIGSSGLWAGAFFTCFAVTGNHELQECRDFLALPLAA